MEKVIFEDLPSTNTPINANNLNKSQDNAEKAINEVANSVTALKTTLEGKNIFIIKASGETAITTAGTEQVYAINTKTITRGEDIITIANGKATVKKELGLCRITGSVQIYSAPSNVSYLTVRVYKNGISIGNVRFRPLASYQTYPISVFYDEISENDVLEVRMLSDSTSLKLNGVSIIVEQL